MNKIISIVTPCLNEEENVEVFYRAIVSTFDAIPRADFELLFVDDGSTDATAQKIRVLIEKDSRCRLIIHGRNVGVYRSAFHALRFAGGDATIPLMPIDLQDPPELIPKFIEAWLQGNKVVAGQRFEREEHFLMRAVRSAYYRFVSKMADFDLPLYVGEFQLLDRSIVKELTQIDDYYPYTRGLIASLTSHRVIVPYKWQKRLVGKSNMNLKALIDQGLNGLVSTSTAPLRGLLFANSMAALAGFSFGVFQIIAHFTFAGAITDPGISTIIVLVSGFAGLTAISLGVLGEYISAIHSQVRGRWRIPVREFVNVPGQN